MCLVGGTTVGGWRLPACPVLDVMRMSLLTLSLAGLPRMAGSAECRDQGAWAPGRPRQQGTQHPRGVHVLLLTLRGARQGPRGEVVLNATESQLRRGEGREGSGDGWQGWFHSGVNARHLTT